MSAITKIVPVLLKDRLPRSISWFWPSRRYGYDLRFDHLDPMSALLDFSFYPKVDSGRSWFRRLPCWLPDYLAPYVAESTR